MLVDPIETDSLEEEDLDDWTGQPEDPQSMVGYGNPDQKSGTESNQR